MVAIPNIADTHQVTRPSATRRQGRAADGRETEPNTGDFAGALGALLSTNQLIGGQATLKLADASAEQMFDPGNLDPRQQRLASIQEANARGDARSTGANRLDSTSIDARRTADQALTPAGDTSATTPNRDVASSDTTATTSALDTLASAPESSKDNPRTSTPHQLQRHGARTNDAPNVLQQHSVKPSATVADQNAARGSEPANVNALAATAGAEKISAAPRSVADELAQSLNAKRTGAAESVKAPIGSAGASDNRSTQKNSGRSDRTAESARQQGGSPSRPAGEPESLERTAFDRLVRSIRFKHSAGQSTARLHLDPPELGRMRVDVRMVDNELQIEIRAEKSEARDMLSQRAELLRTALEQHDIHVDRIAVLSDDPLAFDQHNDAEPAFQEGGPQTEPRTDHQTRARPAHAEHNIAHGVPEDDKDQSEVTVGERRVDVMV